MCRTHERQHLSYNHYICIGVPESLQNAANTIAVRFALLTGAGFIAGYLEVALWAVAGHRQACRAREDYLRALLRREVASFDREDAGTLTSQALRDLQDMHRGIGEKVGSVVHFTCTFLSSVALGFVLGWQLSLLILACMPVLAASIVFLEYTQSRATRLSNDAYSDAGYSFPSLPCPSLSMVIHASLKPLDL